MDTRETLEEIRRLVGVNAPVVTVSSPADMLTVAGMLAPEFKVQLMEAMGFTPQRQPHQLSCMSIQGSGYICTCVQPPTVWIQPHDVDVLRHETPNERRAATQARNAQEEEDEEDARNEFDPAPVL